MYVCMYVRTYVGMYVCMYVCMYVRMYICTYVGHVGDYSTKRSILLRGSLSKCSQQRTNNTRIRNAVGTSSGERAILL